MWILTVTRYRCWCVKKESVIQSKIWIHFFTPVRGLSTWGSHDQSESFINSIAIDRTSLILLLNVILFQLPIKNHNFYYYYRFRCLRGRRIFHMNVCLWIFNSSFYSPFSEGVLNWALLNTQTSSINCLLIQFTSNYWTTTHTWNSL